MNLNIITPHGFKKLPPNTLTLFEYETFKRELLSTTTLKGIAELKNKYHFTKGIRILLLDNLLSEKYGANSIPFLFKMQTFDKINSISSITPVRTIFENHIKGMIINHMIIVLKYAYNNVYLNKIDNVNHDKIRNVKKLLLYCQGDFNSIHDTTLQSKIKQIIKKIEELKSQNVLVYTYDKNQYLLPDFSSTEMLATFCVKNNNFDSVALINCSKEERFNYQTEFFDIINAIVNPNGYIFTSADNSIVLDHYKGHKTKPLKNNLFIIKLNEKAENVSLPTKPHSSKKEQQSESHLAEEAREAMKRKTPVIEIPSLKMNITPVSTLKEELIHFIAYNS